MHGCELLYYNNLYLTNTTKSFLKALRRSFICIRYFFTGVSFLNAMEFAFVRLLIKYLSE